MSAHREYLHLVTTQMRLDFNDYLAGKIRKIDIAAARNIKAHTLNKVFDFLYGEKREHHKKFNHS